MPYPQSFQPQLSSRPPSQPPPPVLASSQRIQQQHQVLNPPSLVNQPTPPNYSAFPPSHAHHAHQGHQQFNNFQMPPVAGPLNQPNFIQSHPHAPQQPHPMTNFNPAAAAHVYGKPNPVGHQLSPNQPAPPIARPSQQQMAQHLMHSQAHMRSQRIMQQQHQLLQQQRQDELMMICDPLDYLTTRSSALRRYTSNHLHMNSVVGTHWTVKQLLREDHVRLLSKRKAMDPSPPPSDSNQQRKARLRQKIEDIERDIKASEISYQAQLKRIQS